MKISVVVLNYHYKEFFFDCLATLNQARLGDPDVEIVLVDNGSSAADYQRVLAECSRRALAYDALVRVEQNDGFGKGMNAGARAATGDVVVFLNNDTLVGRNALRALREEALAAPADTGFFAIPLYDCNYKDGRFVPTANWQCDVTALTAYISCMPARHDAIAPQYVLGPPGPAVAMHRRLLDDLLARHGFVYDPHFYLYGEDVDLFLRARWLGYQTRFVPGTLDEESIIWHAGSATNAPSASTGAASMEKSPLVASLFLFGVRDNIRTHAGRLEAPLVWMLHGLFLLGFLALYGMVRPTRDLWALLKTRRPERPRPTSTGPRPWGFRLLRQTTLLYRKPLPWAAATKPPRENHRMAMATIPGSHDQ